MQRRCIFLTCGQKSHPVGTVTAWYGYWGEELYGRLHFLGILPEHQGKKLGKPLVGLAMRRMKELNHEKAYLTTDSTKLVAIRIYLDYCLLFMKYAGKFMLSSKLVSGDISSGEEYETAAGGTDHRSDKKDIKNIARIVKSGHPCRFSDGNTF